MRVPDGGETDETTANSLFSGVTPIEFEEHVGRLLRLGWRQIPGAVVRLHDQVVAADGTYDLDATVRYQLGGMNFVIVVEAKRHRNPIKRELVQVLFQKVQSIGAHKGLMISTAPYQKGAIKYAKAHGIALATCRADQPEEGAGGGGLADLMFSSWAYPVDHLESWGLASMLNFWVRWI